MSASAQRVIRIILAAGMLLAAGYAGWREHEWHTTPKTKIQRIYSGWSVNFCCGGTYQEVPPHPGLEHAEYACDVRMKSMVVVCSPSGPH